MWNTSQLPQNMCGTIQSWELILAASVTCKGLTICFEYSMYSIPIAIMHKEFQDVPSIGEGFGKNAMVTNVNHGLCWSFQLQARNMFLIILQKCCGYVCQPLYCWSFQLQVRNVLLIILGKNNASTFCSEHIEMLLPPMSKDLNHQYTHTRTCALTDYVEYDTAKSAYTFSIMGIAINNR